MNGSRRNKFSAFNAFNDSRFLRFVHQNGDDGGCVYDQVHIRILANARMRRQQALGGLARDAYAPVRSVDANELD